MFNFGVLQPFIDDDHITDIDSNGSVVYVYHDLEGKKKVLNLQDNFFEDLLTKISNYKDINKEFNFHSPILEGTMDGLRIHAVHQSVVKPHGWLSIRKNPSKLVVKENEFINFFKIIDLANKLNWSYVFGGERGSGKTQLMRSCVSKIDPHKSISIIAENDEMKMNELLPNHLIASYIINEKMSYKDCAKSVLRDNSDYVVFQEVRDQAIDDLLLILSSSSRVLTTLHLKNALLLPERIIELSNQSNDKRLKNIIHDYINLCIVPKAEFVNGKVKRYIAEMALFWNDENHCSQKQLIYESDGEKEILYPFPEAILKEIKKKNILFNWE